MANDLNGNLPVNVKFTRNYSPVKKHIIDSHFKAIDKDLGDIKTSINIDAEAAIPTDVTIPTDPTGGTTTDDEARTAINGINDVLRDLKLLSMLL